MGDGQKMKISKSTCFLGIDFPCLLFTQIWGKRETVTRHIAY